MPKKVAPSATPFDAELQPNESILWLEQQEWLNDQRVTVGQKPWLVFLGLFSLLTLGSVVIDGWQDTLLLYGILLGTVGVFALPIIFYRWRRGELTQPVSQMPTYFQCWYAVTNRRLMAALDDKVDSLSLLEIVASKVEPETGQRGSLDFSSADKTLHFIDIPDAERIHALILEQQAILRRLEQADATPLN